MSRRAPRQFSLYLVASLLCLDLSGCGSRTELHSWGAASIDGQSSGDDPAEASGGSPSTTPSAGGGPSPAGGGPSSAGGGPSSAGGSPNPPEFCEDFSLNYTSLPATVLILLDASGSMTNKIGASTRWDLVGSALFDEDNGLITQLGPSVRFGLALYSSLDGFSGGTCPLIEFSDFALDQASELTSIFFKSTPLRTGDTPTGEALDSSIDRLLADENAGPRYLVLITDGQPDTCAVPDPQRGQPEALAAARRAYESGIETFIVGVSSDIAPGHLQEMSNVAQGVRQEAVWGIDDDAVQPIQASEQQDVLSKQIKGVLGDVRSCVISVSSDVRDDGTVELDGKPLRPGEDYALGEGTLTLKDDTCDRVLADASELNVRLRCRE